MVSLIILTPSSFHFSVSYCSRQHQVQHWKTGGHREACTANCTRCLEPMWSNDGECYVEHPSHLRKEKEQVSFNFQMADVTKTAVCRACDQELTIKEGAGCKDCTRDCGFIVDGPKVCFEGKHTSGPLPASDKRRVWKGVVTIKYTKNLQVHNENHRTPFKWGYFPRPPFSKLPRNADIVHVCNTLRKHGQFTSQFLGLLENDMRAQGLSTNIKFEFLGCKTYF